MSSIMTWFCWNLEYESHAHFQIMRQPDLLIRGFIILCTRAWLCVAPLLTHSHNRVCHSGPGAHLVGQPVQHGQVVKWVTKAYQGGRRWSWEKARWSEVEGGLIRAQRGLNLTLISGNLLGGITDLLHLRRQTDTGSEKVWESRYWWMTCTASQGQVCIMTYSKKDNVRL